MSQGRYTLRGRATQGRAFAGWALADLRGPIYVTTRLLLRGTNTASKGLSGVELRALPLSSTSAYKAILTGSSE